MMSKAAFLMQDHLRRNYVMITDISNPNTFLVRGRLPFPQGMMAVAVLFKNKRPADVYAHPYFIEKQSDPSQPSPQLHLTEESQGIMKIISGLRYMRDDNTKLDNTMVFVTDYKVEVEGRMPCVPAEAAEPHAGPGVATHAHDGDGTSLSLAAKIERKKDTLTLEQRAMLRRSVHHVQQLPGGGGDGGLGLGGMRNPLATTGGGREDSRGPGFSDSTQGTTTTTSAAAAAAATATADPADDQSTIPGYSTFPSAEDCAADSWFVYRYLKAAIFGRRALKEEEECNPSHRLNVPALFQQCRGGYTVLYNPIEVNEKTFMELILKLQREERVVKAIVVPTRPAWRQLQVWADVFPDAELICSGEVPLIRPPGGVPNAAPAAEKAPSTSGIDTQAPSSSDGSPAATAQAAAAAAAVGADEWRGGCQDLGNGVTGLSFPEVDLEAEAAAERARVEAAEAKARATAAAAQREYATERQQQRRYQQTPRHPPASTSASDSTSSITAAAAAVAGDASVPSSKRVRGAQLQDEGADTNSVDGAPVDASTDPYAAQRRRQEEKIRLRQELAEEEARLRSRASEVSSGVGAAAAGIPEEEEAGGEKDLVDVLWQDASFFAERGQQPVGLRESDAGRLRILAPRPSSSNATHEHQQSRREGRGASSPSSSLSSATQPTDHVQLTPTIELLRIPGDATTEEYVLYDANSHTLACTDLYHGAYADFDPANSWMCRVWFKFMKRGDYKRTDIAPRYKWLQVLQQHSLGRMQHTVEVLTRTRPIRFLLFAHGTPPLQNEGVNLLRQQWSLPPLHPAEMPRAKRDEQR